jgi:hypothetical protein
MSFEIGGCQEVLKWTRRKNMKQTTVTQVAALFDGDAFLAVSVNGDIKYSGRADTLATNKLFSDVLVSSISTPVTADSATILRVGDQN